MCFRTTSTVEIPKPPSSNTAAVTVTPRPAEVAPALSAAAAAAAASAAALASSHSVAPGRAAPGKAAAWRAAGLVGKAYRIHGPNVPAAFRSKLVECLMGAKMVLEPHAGQ